MIDLTEGNNPRLFSGAISIGRVSGIDLVVSGFVVSPESSAVIVGDCWLTDKGLLIIT